MICWIFMGWREKVNPETKKFLETQINEASKDKSYLHAKNPGNAQLWLAVANLTKAIVDLEMRLDSLENSMIEAMRMRQKVLSNRKKY